MELSRSNTVIILLLILLLFVWRYEQHDEVQNNSVLVVTDDGVQAVDSVPAEDEETSRNFASSDNADQIEISQHIVKTTEGFVGLPITVYELQPPLLPKARLLDFREYDNRLWFAGDAGLYSFDLSTERWFAKTRGKGLPRDTAYGIERVDGGLYLDLLDWTKEGHLSNGLYLEFDGSRFKKSSLTDATAKTNGRAIPDKSPLQGRLADYQGTASVDWYCFRGKHGGRELGFVNGGVLKHQPATEQRTIYQQSQGLLKNYCTSIAIDRDNTVWVSHWDEEAGLSYLPQGAARWQRKPHSANEVPLGAPSIFAYDRFLFLAQQRALVIYDPLSDMAIDITEDLGLSGFIVSDVQYTQDGRIWASSYRYAPGGKGQAAAGLISFQMSDVTSLFEPGNIQFSLRAAGQ